MTVANVTIAESKEADIFRREVIGRGCDRERVRGQAIIVQESLIHALAQFIFLIGKLRVITIAYSNWLCDSERTTSATQIAYLEPSKFAGIPDWSHLPGFLPDMAVD